MIISLRCEIAAPPNTWQSYAVVCRAKMAKVTAQIKLVSKVRSLLSDAHDASKNNLDNVQRYRDALARAGDAGNDE